MHLKVPKTKKGFDNNEDDKEEGLLRFDNIMGTNAGNRGGRTVIQDTNPPTIKNTVPREEQEVQQEEEDLGDCS